MDNYNETTVTSSSGIKNVLENAPYPCNRLQLADYAAQSGADEGEVELIHALPDVEYNSWADVDMVLGDSLE